jgi:hypothetical protein
LLIAVAENLVATDVRAVVAGLRIDWSLFVEKIVMSKGESTVVMIAVVVERSSVVDWNPIQNAHAM